MPFHLCIFFTCVPEIVVIVTNRLGTFNLVNSWIVAELDQTTNECREVYGPFDSLEGSIIHAQQIVNEIYKVQGLLHDDFEL